MTLTFDLKKKNLLVTLTFELWIGVLIAGWSKALAHTSIFLTAQVWTDPSVRKCSLAKDHGFLWVLWFPLSSKKIASIWLREYWLGHLTSLLYFNITDSQTDRQTGQIIYATLFLQCHNNYHGSRLDNSLLTKHNWSVEVFVTV